MYSNKRRLKPLFDKPAFLRLVVRLLPNLNQCSLWRWLRLKDIILSNFIYKKYLAQLNYLWIRIPALSNTGPTQLFVNSNTGSLMCFAPFNLSLHSKVPICLLYWNVNHLHKSSNLINSSSFVILTQFFMGAFTFLSLFHKVSSMVYFKIKI